MLATASMMASYGAPSFIPSAISLPRSFIRRSRKSSTFGTTYNSRELFFNPGSPETEEPTEDKDPDDTKDPPRKLGPDVA